MKAKYYKSLESVERRINDPQFNAREVFVIKKYYVFNQALIVEEWLDWTSTSNTYSYKYPKITHEEHLANRWEALRLRAANEMPDNIVQAIERFK